MDLNEKFLSLTAEKKRVVHFVLCGYALSLIDNYFAETGSIEYCESIVGTRQVVDPHLPSDAFAAAGTGSNIKNVNYRYGEPLSALQDDDLIFPDHIELAFYSIYNLFRKYALKDEIDDWLIVNQAISAETNEDKWSDLLMHAIEKTNE